MPWPLPDRAVLGVFGKRPTAGLVKTRLAEGIGPDLAAEVAQAMLSDTLDLWGSDRVLAPGGRRVLVFDPPDAGPWFDPIVPQAFAIQPQADGDLGNRMRAFFEGEFEEGADRVVLIGSDAPALDPSVVVSAFLCLEGRDVVLGPASDGGYYLVGARGEPPPIFEGVDWSTPKVLSQTIDRLNSTGLTLGLLPPCYDIDVPADLQTLAGHFRAMRRAGIHPGMARTESILSRALPR